MSPPGSSATLPGRRASPLGQRHPPRHFTVPCGDYLPGSPYSSGDTESPSPLTPGTVHTATSQKRAQVTNPNLSNSLQCRCLPEGFLSPRTLQVVLHDPGHLPRTHSNSQPFTVTKAAPRTGPIPSCEAGQATAQGWAMTRPRPCSNSVTKLAPCRDTCSGIEGTQSHLPPVSDD